MRWFSKKKPLGESSLFCVFWWTTVKYVWFDCLLRKYFKGSIEIEYLKIHIAKVKKKLKKDSSN